MGRLVDSGTHLVLAGDGDNRDFVSIARHFGFEVTGQPLGAVRGDGFTTFHAWAVTRLPAGADSLSAGGGLFGGTLKQGTGRVTVIADGAFLLSKNLEQEYEYDAENGAFVKRLLEQ